MTSVEIFTDGACRGNPGPGGWAALLRSGEVQEGENALRRAATAASGGSLFARSPLVARQIEGRGAGRGK